MKVDIPYALDTPDTGLHLIYVHHAVFVGEQYEETPTDDLHFPLSADLVNYTRSEDISTIIVPLSLVQEQLQEAGDHGIMGHMTLS